MPLVRITLRADLAEETKLAIADAIHTSLVNEFKIPADDLFHIFEEVKPSQMQFPKHYLGVDHGEKVVFIQIFAGQGRTLDQKKALYASIAKLACEKQKEIAASDFIISLVETNGLENWSFGNGEIQLPPHLAALAAKKN